MNFNCIIKEILFSWNIIKSDLMGFIISKNEKGIGCHIDNIKKCRTKVEMKRKNGANRAVIKVVLTVASGS